MQGQQGEAEDHVLSDKNVQKELNKHNNRSSIGVIMGGAKDDFN